MKFDRPTVLILVATLLTGLVVVDRLRAPDEAPVRPERQAESPKQEVLAGQQPADAVAPSNAPLTKKADDFPDIVARPLFNPDRRPAAIASDVAEAPAFSSSTSMDSFDLIGVASAPNGRKYAMLRRKNPEEILSVSQGKVIDGWRLRDAGAGGAVFEKNGAVVELKMARAGDAAGSAISPGAEPKGMPPRVIIPTDSMLGIANGSSK